MLYVIGLAVVGYLGFKAGKWHFMYEMLKCCQEEESRIKLFNMLTKSAEDFTQVEHNTEPHLPA